MASSIPIPSSRWRLAPAPLRPLLPIHPPSDIPLPLPTLPSPQRTPHIHPDFALSTHLVPAAHIRTTRHTPFPPSSIADSPYTEGKKPTREEKARRATQLRAWLLDVRAKEAGHNVGHERVLWNCVNRYYRVDSGRRKTSKGLTLFFAHANGFPKETWEPTLKHLLASSAHLIDEVWTWEAVQHGDSALINADALSSVYDWIDNTRDILNFFTYFMPSSPFSGATLPTHLTRIPAPESDQRVNNGLLTRTIVGVGHSFGGCTSALAALHNPKLFSSLVLIDPVLTIPRWPGEPIPVLHSDGLSVSALSRRDGWSSRSEALKLFQKNPFFAAWDPSVLEIYIECGLYTAPPSTRTSPGQTTKLKMPPIHESIVFDDTHTGREVFANTHSLDPKIKLRWVVPGVDNPEEMGPPGVLQQRIWLRPTNSSNVKIPNAGHLIPLEKPRELADDMRDFLRETYSEKRAKL